MMDRRIRTLCVALAFVTLPLGTTGCATSIAQWIVRTRNHQGDIALAHRNFADASNAYQLALKIDPHDEHARDGLVGVQIRIAQADFSASKFDAAIDALMVAGKYSPDDPRVSGLRSAIEQAEIKRDIVLSNYPQYKVAGTSLLRGYAQTRPQLTAIVGALQRFNYTYDTNDLAAAIKDSYVLGDDVARLTSRLVQYRQLVESGVPEHAGDQSVAAPASLLPLP